MNHRITIAELGGIFHFYRNTAETFYQLFPYQSGMPRSSASHNYKATSLEQTFLMINNRRQYYFITVRIDASTHTVVNTIGLFEYLLQHEMRVSSFLQLSQIHFHRTYFGILKHVIQIDDFQRLVSANHRYLPILQIHHFIRILYNRSSIRGQKKFILPYPYHQRTAFTGYNNLIGIILVKHRYGVCTNHLMQSQLNGSK